jgi:hypothetical protein
MDRFDVGAMLMNAANCKGASLAPYTLVYPKLLNPPDNLAAKVRTAGWTCDASLSQEEVGPEKDESVRLMTQCEVAQDQVLYAALHIDISEYDNAHAKEDSEPGQAFAKESKLRPRANSEDSTATRNTTATEDSTATRSTTTTQESTRSSLATEDSEESMVTGASTTLMIGGFPCHMNLSELGRVISDQGFENSFDLVYLPRPKGLRTRNRSSQVNKGYAFVNFKTPELATAFAESFARLTFQSGQLEKKCYAKPAMCQGYTTNLKQFSAYPDCCLLSF